MEEPVSLSESGQIETDYFSSIPQTELLSMTVELNDGLQDMMKVHLEDDPTTLANEFVENHSLKPSMEGSLANLIQKSKERAEMRVASASTDMYNWATPDKLRAESSEKPRKSLKRSESVFDRLYRQSKKECSLEVPQPSPKQRPLFNYGELLYIKGRSHQEKRRLFINKNTKSEEFTFTPTINALSEFMGPRSSRKPEDSLYKKHEEYMENYKKNRELRRKEEMKECVFFPNGRKRHSSKKHALKISDKLYKDSVERRKRQDLADEPSPKTQTRSLDAQRSWADFKLSKRREFENKLEEIRKDEEFSVPKKSPPPLRDGLSIHEYLYNKRNDNCIKKHQRQLILQEERDKNFSVIKPSPQNNRLFDKFRTKKFTRLFSALDSDKDLKISYDFVSLEQLDIDTVDALTPIIKLLDEGNELDLHSFVAVMEEIWPGLSTDQKGALIKTQPLVSSFTQNLSQFKASTSDLYERMVQKQDLADMKREKIREILDVVEMKDCTFRPVINEYKKYKYQYQ